MNYGPLLHLLLLEALNHVEDALHKRGHVDEVEGLGFGRVGILPHSHGPLGYGGVHLKGMLSSHTIHVLYLDNSENNPYMLLKTVSMYLQ